MDCARVEEELIAYHLETATDEERDAIDAHLLTCGSCLRAYLALKHHTDRSGKHAPVPSDAMRAKLRAEVAREFRPAARARFRSMLAKPIPLYQGLCAGAAAAVIAWAVPTAMSHVHVTVSADDHETANVERIDTARTKPVSLTVY